MLGEAPPFPLNVAWQALRTNNQRLTTTKYPLALSRIFCYNSFDRSMGKGVTALT
jgi:hypothetical protein